MASAERDPEHRPSLLVGQRLVRRVGVSLVDRHRCREQPVIWWYKARAVPALLATLIATIALGLLIGDAQLPVPALTGASGDFLIGHLITLAPAIVFLYGTGRGDLATRTVATRPLRVWDTSLAGAIGLLGLSTAIVGRLADSDGLTTVLGRSLAGYTALALLIMPLLGQHLSTSALACIPLTCAATGWARNGQPEQWAWILHPADSLPALLLVAALLPAGMAFALTWRRPPLTVRSL
ncbi:hypothetical protein ACFWUZ_34395 [Streptomyces sp. NPDC058646]|uniref:hypothetical protein n=1 Tax=Streptomyces sp. NPDC058646 TaxID=3346574 RepID=UPI00364B4BE8